MNFNENELTKAFNVFCRYCLYEKGYSKETIKTYKYSFNALLKYSEIENFLQLSENNVRNFIYWGKENLNWSNSAIAHHRKNLSPFFKWCVEQNYIAKNPFKNIPSPKVESKIPEVFSDKEIERMIYCVKETLYQKSFIQKRNLAIIGVFLMLGIRRSELINLRINDINFENSTVTIHGSSSKSKRDRLLPIPTRLRYVLLNYVKERKQANKTSPYFFCSYWRDVRFTINGLRYFFDELQKETKIRIYPHKFRHTFATKCLESGMDLETIKQLLGHRNIVTTTIYLHTTVRHLSQRIEINKLNNLF